MEGLLLTHDLRSTEESGFNWSCTAIDLPLSEIPHRAGQLLAQVVWRPERDNVWLTSNQIATDSRSTVELRAPFVLACGAILFLRPAITWRRRCRARCRFPTPRDWTPPFLQWAARK